MTTSTDTVPPPPPKPPPLPGGAVGFWDGAEWRAIYVKSGDGIVPAVVQIGPTGELTLKPYA